MVGMEFVCADQWQSCLLCQVSEGQEMLVLEAMKMQNSLTAGKMGKVRDDQWLSFYWSLLQDTAVCFYIFFFLIYTATRVFFLAPPYPFPLPYCFVSFLIHPVSLSPPSVNQSRVFYAAEIAIAISKSTVVLPLPSVPSPSPSSFPSPHPFHHFLNPASGMESAVNSRLGPDQSPIPFKCILNQN